MKMYHMNPVLIRGSCMGLALGSAAGFTWGFTPNLINSKIGINQFS